MAGLIGPADRWVYTVSAGNALKAVKGAPSTFYLDEALTQVAPIRAIAGDALIAESTVLTDAFSRFPLFRFPEIDGVKIDTLYTSVGNNGPVVAVYARVDDRVDALETSLDLLIAQAAEFDERITNLEVEPPLSTGFFIDDDDPSRVYATADSVFAGITTDGDVLVVDTVLAAGATTDGDVLVLTV